MTMLLYMHNKFFSASFSANLDVCLFFFQFEAGSDKSALELLTNFVFYCSFLLFYFDFSIIREYLKSKIK